MNFDISLNVLANSYQIRTLKNYTLLYREEGTQHINKLVFTLAQFTSRLYIPPLQLILNCPNCSNYYQSIQHLHIY